MPSSYDAAGPAGVAGLLRARPEFLAGWLAATPGGPAAVARRLNMSERDANRLLLCRAPRPLSFGRDILAIASYLALDPALLASALREAATLAALAQQPATGRLRVMEPEVEFAADDRGAAAALAAARDAVEEAIGPAGEAPAGLRERAAAVWAAAPPALAREVDLEAAVAFAAPVSVVVLPGLDVRAVRAWLASRAVPWSATAAPRPLRGMLLAWRGAGIIFVDGASAPAQRRFTIAHELGHFLLDYLRPRERMLREAPELIEAVDGQRPLTEADRQRAALEGLPLDVHMHLLERDRLGSASQGTEEVEEAASRFALELLAPWDAVLALLRASLSPADGYDAALFAAVRLLQERFALPPEAARARARAALRALGVRRGLLDP